MQITQPRHEPVDGTFAHVDAVHDANGCTIFSAGDVGAAHAMAHRMLDEGRFELGLWDAAFEL